MVRLPDGFQPTSSDVICRRGKTAYEHNQHFRDLIESRLSAYSSASSKLEKSLVVTEVVDLIREKSPLGGFVRQVDGKWYEVGDSIAREKCGGMFRDMLHTKYKSSTKAKKKRRAEGERANSPVNVGSITDASPKSNKRVKSKDRSSSPAPAERCASPTPTPNNNTNTTAGAAPLSPKSSMVFTNILQDIASRKKELALPKLPQQQLPTFTRSVPSASSANAVTATCSSSSLPSLDKLKKPMLPPPPRGFGFLLKAPKTVSLARNCSVLSALSVDLEDEDEDNNDNHKDEFELGLQRLKSVTSTAFRTKHDNNNNQEDAFEAGLTRLKSVTSGAARAKYNSNNNNTQKEDAFEMGLTRLKSVASAALTDDEFKWGLTRLQSVATATDRKSVV